MREKDSNADTSAIERQIDEMVHKPYGPACRSVRLTLEEIAIVEWKK